MQWSGVRPSFSADLLPPQPAGSDRRNWAESCNHKRTARPGQGQGGEEGRRAGESRAGDRHESAGLDRCSHGRQPRSPPATPPRDMGRFRLQRKKLPTVKTELYSYQFPEIFLPSQLVSGLMLLPRAAEEKERVANPSHDELNCQVKEAADREQSL